MNPTARANAIAEIQRIFAAYRAAQPTDAANLAALTNGKLYELFVLSDLLVDLASRGFALVFVGSRAPSGSAATSHSTLKFKAGPGKIKLTDSHFEVRSPQSTTVVFRIFVDIEFDTLGHSRSTVADNSRRHELDIIVTTATNDYPAHDEIALGVECKAVANFGKGIIKEALGVRRELSLLHKPVNSMLTAAGGSPALRVPAYPPSEFRLVFIDPKGSNYAQSPGVYGIEFKHLEP
ncbi:hypothetical protein GOB83_12515 [Acetobacter fabarum]|uniref:hypothetical protein n=3 Tax=Acetobacter fabarum TaxID=483199 RepID=UPI00140501E9|nr:hypothetical protein [Acetobacter fabarum]NHO42989.1 hypothetical protein [Acetobacter fabarum]